MLWRRNIRRAVIEEKADKNPLVLVNKLTFPSGHGPILVYFVNVGTLYAHFLPMKIVGITKYCFK